MVQLFVVRTREKIPMNLNDIKTLADDAEVVWSKSYSHLPKLINKFGFKKGVEVGVAFAGHAEYILNNTNVKQIIGIDPYRHLNNYDDPMNYSNNDFEKINDFVQERMKTFKGRYKHLRLLSTIASQKVGSDLDFVYLDADHSYEGLKSDISVWYEKVRVGGIIAGHDYGHENFPGVKKAVDEFFSRFGWTINWFNDGVWWVKKEKINISFIIPAYNCETTVAASVSSIFNGNFEPDDEVIIVNDASTDGTKNELKKISKKYAQVRIFNNKHNLGGGATRNIAVNKSNNTLVFCLDSDNILQKKSVPRLKDFLIISGSDIAAFEKVTFFKNKTINVSHEWKFKKKIYNLEEVLKSTKTPISSGNYLYTKKSWLDAGFYPESVRALDAWGFGLRQVATNHSLSVLKESNYFHRIGIESYWIREVRKKQTSLLALSVLIPYLDRMSKETIDYLFHRESRDSWFENLQNRPLVVKKIKSRPILLLKISSLLIPRLVKASKLIKKTI
jgi:glycosyltransferase involved in cell wall biosynthesis